MKEITAKIAQVVTDRQIALNAGSDAGVTHGSTVIIYERVEITDPDSKEMLGAVRVPKLNLRVSLVNPAFCLATVTSRTGSASLSLSLVSKTVTTEYSSSPSQVRVVIGEPVTIQIAEEREDEEPPF